MSDFGFDGYALDGADAAGHLDPLEIARDLIAAGKPRSALEVLSLHYDSHVEDQEYLLLCAEAWRANGDTARAQHALLGAARVAPGDPRPLRALGELLAERGEHERAERVLAKARALELTDEGQLPLDDMAPDPEEDLIAAAERQERRSQVAVSPRQISVAVLGLAAFTLLIAGINRLAEPRAEPEPASQAPIVQSGTPEPTPTTTPPVSSLTTQPVEIAADVVPTTEIVEVEPPEAEPPPAIVLPKVASDPPPARPRRAKPHAPIRSPSVPTGREARPPAVETAEEPDPASVRADLESTDPAQLTTRGDWLHAQGHPALALTYYRRALEIDPDYAPALVGMGRGILRAEKYGEAMANATRALQLARGVDARPGLEAEAIYQMGRVHLERGDRDAARQLLRQAVSLDGVPEEAWFYLGEALASDNSPAARRAYEKYLKLVPDGSLADRARRAIQ